MSAVNRSLRSASKQLRLQTPRVASPACLRSASVGALRIAGSLPASRNTFSTSAARLSGAPNMTSGNREYDPEIKDIADFVANKPINSELAVSARPAQFFVFVSSRDATPRPNIFCPPRDDQCFGQFRNALPLRSLFSLRHSLTCLPSVRHCSMDPPRHPRLRS